MLTLRVKQIANDELEIRILDATTTAPAPEILPTHERLSQEREAGNALKGFLKDGARTASDCWEFLRGAGFRTDELNPTRARRSVGAETFHRDRRSWWVLAAPLREAASELKNFLNAGERPATECEAHLQAAGRAVDEMTLWLVRRYAGVVTAQKDGQSWWSASGQFVEIAESFHFADDPRLEIIEEDNCGFIG